MPDESQHAEAKDPRVDAALREYLERHDRGEPVNREEFLSRHAEIADDLRSFIAAEEGLRKLAGGPAPHDVPARRDVSGISTRSFAAGGQETVPPKSKADRAPETTGGGLAGQFGRYQIVRALGSGAMGAVYLAEDTQLERRVAIKTPHFGDDPTGELLARFYREARAAATLRHANTCPVYDVGEIEGKHFISMAYIEGHPLSELISAKKPQTERQILLAVHKLSNALQQAHGRGIVHRDLKPANIMIDKQGEPIIMDFGLARKAQKEGEASLTRSGMILGSPAYMSPEQVEGDQDKIGPATDQYSLGVILYELLTGQLPFRGTVVNVLAQIITKNPTPPSELRPGLDPRIETVCLRMMSKKASDRFPSIKGVANQLATIVKSPAVAPIAAEKSPTASRSPAAPSPPRENAAASQIRKSAKQKALTESDVASLEELVRKCLRRRDYDLAIQTIERIPEGRRNDALETLLEKARDKVDKIALLICEIDEADRLEDGQTALKTAAELLKIKPRHDRAREIQEKYSEYVDGGAARIGLPPHSTKPRSVRAWFPWSLLAFGVAVFAGMYGVMVIYLGRTAVVLDIKDPGVEVAVKGPTLTVTGPDKQSIKVEPGEQELKITSAGFKATTKRFSLKRGETKTVTVSIVNNEIVARLENENLPSPFVHDKKTSSLSNVAKKEVVTIQSPEKKQADTVHGTPPADPDRAAAKWVMSIGGAIKIRERGGNTQMKAEYALPSGAFELTVINLGRNPKVTETGLAYFKDCMSVDSLDLSSTQVGDVGLAYFEDCKNLTNLSLHNTEVTDVTLERLAGFPKLVSLSVKKTNVTEAGVKRLAAALPQCKIEWDGEARGPKAVALEHGFVPLFNGKDLSGWTAVENGGSWTVDNQKVLTGQGSQEVGMPLILIADQGTYEDFELAIQILNAETSALQAVIRRSAVGKHYSGYGIAATDMRVGAGRLVRRGSIYRGEKLMATSSHSWDASAKASQVGAGEWYTLTITAVGNHIKSAIGGTVVADYEDPGRPFETGGIALILRSDKTVHIKEIKIKRLTP